MRIAIKRPGEEIEIVETEKQYVNDACKEILGKDVRPERVGIAPELNMYCDEEFISKNLKGNFFIITNNKLLPLQLIAGDSVFVRRKPVNIWEEEIWDYEVEDITEDDIELIKQVIMEL